MSDQRPPTPPDPALVQDRRDEARKAAEAIHALLATAPFEHHLGINALARIIADDKSPAREKRRAGEVLAKLEVDLRQHRSELAGARELALADLGVDSASRRAFGALLAAQINVDSRQQQIVLGADAVEALAGLQSTDAGRAALSAGLREVMGLPDWPARGRSGSGHGGNGHATIDFPIPPPPDGGS